MNRKINRSIAAVCAAATLCTPLSTASVLSDISLSPMIASAADASQTVSSGDCTGDYYSDTNAGIQLYYKIVNNGAVIKGCKTTKNYTSVYIPMHIGGKEVTGVADNAFKGQTSITNVFFYGSDKVYQTYYSPGGSYIGGATFVGGSSIAEIGKSAFEGCTELKYVRFGDKEVTVKDDAFYKCSKLESVNTYDSAGQYVKAKYKSIGSFAFSRTGLKTFECGKCGSIGEKAFYCCANLKSVDITADSLGSNCFQACRAMTDVKVKADTIGYRCFGYYVERADIDARSIGGQAFSNCTSLKELKLRNTRSIGQGAFYECKSLKNVVFPETIEYIGDEAFLGDSNLCSPVMFVKGDGESLEIGRSAFLSTAVEYVVLSGNITVNSNAFMHCDIKGAVVEGNVNLQPKSLGYSSWNPIPGFTIYGDADSNSYAENCGLNYVKVDKSQSYDKIMNDNKKYFMGINTFENKNGTCAGMSIMQMFAMTGRIDLSTLLPAGQEMIDIPGNAYVDHVPEYSAFCDQVINYHKNQLDYLHYDHSLSITPETLEGYAKLTEYGITVPGVLRIVNHRHVVTFLGVEKLETPVEIYDALAGEYKTYNYRVIMSDSGYRFKYDENGNLLARGADSRTWKPGWTEDMGWIPVEETYMYLSTSEGTVGDCYTARWEHEENVKPESTKTTFDQLMLVLSSTVKN